jgi:catechol 2,3-dioxygenase-like lactoylglutathione lyase family enzyme
MTVVTIGARDMSRLRGYYQSLGWTEQPGSSDEFATYLLGGALLALYPIGELAAEAGLDPAGGPGVITLATNVDTRDEVDTAYAAAVAAGAEAVAEPQDRFWGGRSAYVADPEGTRWEIAWAPMVVLDQRGALLGFGGEPDQGGDG